MSRKLELLRRDSKSSSDLCPSPAPSGLHTPHTHHSSDTLVASAPAPPPHAKYKPLPTSTPTQRPTSLDQPHSNRTDQQQQQQQQRPPSRTFKTFFHRIGSTGMLNHKSSASLLQPTAGGSGDRPSAPAGQPQPLYRSSSTSQLNSTTILSSTAAAACGDSSSYVKCADPSDGVKFINGNGTLIRKGSGSGLKSAASCAHGSATNPSIAKLQANCTKSSSCDDIAKVAAESAASPTGDPARKGFPYAFLRSKLSVLPEENGGSVLNHQRRSAQQPQQQQQHRTADLLDLSDASATPQPNLRRFHYAAHASACSPTSSTATTNSGDPANDRSPSGSSRSSSMRHGTHAAHQHHSSDECSSNLSNSPRASSTMADWSPLEPGGGGGSASGYQRLSSCLSSNESGYDSDGRHVEETSTAMRTQMVSSNASSVGPRSSLDFARTGSTETLMGQGRGFSSSSSSLSMPPAASTIRRRFRQIKLLRTKADDCIGVQLAPQFFHLTEVDMEIRYLIVDIDCNGLAYR